MKEGAVGNCRFEGKAEKLTVGDVFDMYCEWPITTILSSPVRIRFPKNKNPEDQFKPKQSPYSLVVLDTVKILPGRGAFKVTGYKPGSYESGFTLVSNEGTINMAPLTWTIESVLPKNQKEVKPYPPFGPWREPLPFWYGLLGISVLTGFIVFSVLKTVFFVQRKKKIQEVKERLKSKKAFYEFISRLNSMTRNIYKEESSQIVQNLDTHFRLFLENEFFIYAVNKSVKKVIRQLKKYQPHIYRENKVNILNFFIEVQKLSSEKVTTKDCEQLLDLARDIAIKIFSMAKVQTGR